MKLLSATLLAHATAFAALVAMVAGNEIDCSDNGDGSCSADQTMLLQAKVHAEKDLLLVSNLDEAGESPKPAPGLTTVKEQKGLILVVYVKYGESKPAKPLQWIRDQIIGPPPSLLDMWAKASWGQATWTDKDIKFFELESETDPASWGGGSANVVQAIQKQNIYKAELTRLGKVFKNVMIMLPGQAFVGEALPMWEYSIFGGAALTWQTFGHELGHNWGLGHSGSHDVKGSYNVRLDFSIMGFAEMNYDLDFNGIQRYNLGWIPSQQVRSSADAPIQRIRSLNEGPFKDDDAVLMMTIPCPTCKTAGGSVGGDLFLSFRASNPTSLYGPDEYSPQPYEKITHRRLTLHDRIHVHLQPTYGPLDTLLETELWTALNAGDSYGVPDACLWIKICSFSLSWDGPTAAPTPQPPVLDDFVLTATNTISCPAKSSLITDVNGCKGAAFKLGKSYEGKSSWKDSPPGCICLGKQFYFNVPFNDVGAASDHYVMVCKLDASHKMTSMITTSATVRTRQAVVAVSSTSAADAEAKCTQTIPNYVPAVTTSTTTPIPGRNAPCPSFITNLAGQCEKYCETQKIQGVKFATGDMRSTDVCEKGTYCTCRCRTILPAEGSACFAGADSEYVLGDTRLCYYHWCSDRSRFGLTVDTTTPPPQNQPQCNTPAPPKKAATCGGTGNGAPCMFPFTYRGISYSACTNAGHSEPWCYTSVTHKWGNCNCPA